jgi:hypothetical protein
MRTEAQVRATKADSRPISGHRPLSILSGRLKNAVQKIFRLKTPTQAGRKTRRVTCGILGSSFDQCRPLSRLAHISTSGAWHKFVRCGNSADKAKDVRLLGTCRKPDVAIQVLHIPALHIPSALQIPQQAAVDHAAFRARRSHAKKNSPKPPK